MRVLVITDKREDEGILAYAAEHGLVPFVALKELAKQEGEMTLAPPKDLSVQTGAPVWLAANSSDTPTTDCSARVLTVSTSTGSCTRLAMVG